MKKLNFFLILSIFFNINCTEEYLDLTQRNTYHGVSISSRNLIQLRLLDKEIESQIGWQKTSYNINTMHNSNNEIIYYLSYFVCKLKYKELHDELHKLDYLKFDFKFTPWG